MSFGFDSGTTSSIPSLAVTHTEPAHDQDLNFNRIVDRKKDDPRVVTRSIDPEQILRAIENDALGELTKITLAGRPARQGVAMWDILFNFSNRQSFSACLFMADKEYQPIPQSRVVTVSRFLNFSMAISRIYLNKVEEGDRIGIGICNQSTGFTYILLYVAERETSVFIADSESESSRPNRVPAFNLRMEHAIRVDRRGNTSTVDMQEGVTLEEEKALPFVQRITYSVNNVARAYPWKPHFLPFVQESVDRDRFEEELLAKQKELINVSFDRFEKMCQDVYNDSKNRHDTQLRQQRNPRLAASRSPDEPVQKEKLPVVEVVTWNDLFIARFENPNGPHGQGIYAFTRESLGDQAKLERFLFNDDLQGTAVDQDNRVVILSDQFGPNSYLRYFTLNF